MAARMEGGKMTTVALDLSPADLLDRFRGTIVGAAPGYPEVIHLRAEDADGDQWRFSTFHADYSPSDPTFFVGKTIADVTQESSGKLTMAFSDGTEFAVLPGPLEPDESGADLETWHLITPDGLALWYGPRGRWQLSSASDPC